MIRQNKYWARHPPVHLLVAMYMGYEGKKEASDEPGSIAGLTLEQARDATAHHFPDDVVAYVIKKHAEAAVEAARLATEPEAP